MKEKTGARPPLPYRLLKSYVKFFHNNIYYKKFYILNAQNIPENDQPTIIISNHQNCLNDALGILFSITDRRAYFAARADVFKHPLANKFLRYLGLMPILRMKFDGISKLRNNNQTFSSLIETLTQKNTIILYPESGHQSKHWLGDFSLGYTKLAFEAAEKEDFKTEIFILPSCNHYSDYAPMQKEMLMAFGTPISLAPFYECYQTQPRVAQREVNKLARRQIEEMMLNITDEDHYQAIDFIRNTYGISYAAQQNLNPDELPDKLKSDQTLVNHLNQLSDQQPETMQMVYQKTAELEQDLLKQHLQFSHLDAPHRLSRMVTNFLYLLLLSPLFIISLFPNIFIHLLPKMLFKKALEKDPLFAGSFYFALSVLVTIPIFYTLTFIILWISTSLLLSIIYIVFLPWLGIFAWNYSQRMKAWFNDCRAYQLFKKGLLSPIITKKNQLFEMLDSLLKR